MEKNRLDSGSIREDYESDLRWERLRRHHRVLTAFLILLAAVLVGAAWHAYPMLGRHDSLLSQMPTKLTDIRKDVSNLEDQAKSTDAKVDDWGHRQEELRGQLNKARADLMARVDSAKKQASDASTALIQRARSDFATQVDSIKTQLAKLETSRDSDREQIAQLQRGTNSCPKSDEPARPGTRVGAGPGDAERGDNGPGIRRCEIHPAPGPARFRRIRGQIRRETRRL
jgi:peptidoglycan hydrolase CwlO-like protein